MAQKPPKKMKAMQDKEREAPSVGQDSFPSEATSPFSEVDDGGAEQNTQILPAAQQPAAVARASAPAPKTYKEAAALIRADKTLYAKYKAGVASGKAFSLNVGGKDFAYAATPKSTAATPAQRKRQASSSPTEQGWQDAFGDDVATAKKAGVAAEKNLYKLKDGPTPKTSKEWDAYGPKESAAIDDYTNTEPQRPDQGLRDWQVEDWRKNRQARKMKGKRG